MSFLLGILGAIVGIFLVMIVIVLVIRNIIKKYMGNLGIGNFSSVINYASENMRDDFKQIKSIHGMTTLYEPLILKDFPEFNKELLYGMVESNIREVLHALEYRTLIHSDTMELLSPVLQSQIESLTSAKREIKYRDIVFHQHAIKRYERSEGIATITTSSSLEYEIEDVERKFELGIKKQTRCTCRFVYIYDMTKVKNSKETFCLHCQNCGAPLGNLAGRVCEYCGIEIKENNMKTWKMASYHDDYQ